MTARAHKFVRHHDAIDHLRLGWLALPDLDGTSHGQWSVLCVWLCSCPLVQPKTQHQPA